VVCSYLAMCLFFRGFSQQALTLFIIGARMDVARILIISS